MSPKYEGRQEGCGVLIDRRAKRRTPSSSECLVASFCFGSLWKHRIVRIRVVDTIDVEDQSRYDERRIAYDHADQPPDSRFELSFIDLARSWDDETKNRRDSRIPGLF